MCSGHGYSCPLVAASVECPSYKKGFSENFLIRGVFPADSSALMIIHLCAGIDFKLKTFTVQDKKIKLQIWYDARDGPRM